MGYNESKRRWLLFVVCCALVSVPYLVVTYPPSTDLPQHVAQVRLFFDAWQNPGTGYRIQLLTPYNLGYVVIGAFFKALGPVAAGRAALLTVALAWTAAIHYLAARRGRPVEGAVLATVFVFNFTFYWGFYNFIFGFPFFVLWLLLTAESDAETFDVKDGLKLFATALALYFSHAFWFAAAVGWLAVSFVVVRPPRKVAVLRVASIVPVAVVAALWYVSFAKTWYATPASTFDRGGWRTKLNWAWWVDSALGGQASQSEIFIVALSVLWIVVALWRHRRRLSEAVDVPLAVCAVMFAAVTVFAPYNFQNTIFFAERWLPCAFIVALLAVPLPVMLPRPQTLQLAAAGILAAFCLTTALLWNRFEAIENTGLTTALDALPARSRLLGLDFIKISSTVKSQPFMQMHAYGQALKGAELNFSFAEFPHSLVTYDDRSRTAPPWTRKLEWFADTVRPSDFGYFDYALIYTDDESHRHLPARFPITPVTSDGRWRLYKTTVGP